MNFRNISIWSVFRLLTIWIVALFFTTFVDQPVNARASSDDLGRELISASSEDHSNGINKMKLLLSKGADPNLQNRYGMSPLMAAASEEDEFYGDKDTGHISTIKFLLEHGANLEAKASTGATALIFAASMGRTKMVKFLLEHGVNIEARATSVATALFVAVSGGYKDTAKLLLMNGANPNVRDNIEQNHQHVRGFTPLLMAIQRGDSDLTKVLLEHKADPTATMNDGTTPLKLAAFFNNTVIEEQLRKNGAKR